METGNIPIKSGEVNAVANTSRLKKPKPCLLMFWGDVRSVLASFAPFRHVEDGVVIGGGHQPLSASAVTSVTHVP